MSEEKNVLDENEQIAQRRSKLAELRQQGAPFPNDFRRNVIAGELHAEYGDKDPAEIDTRNVRVKVAGRMMTRRVMGKASFAHLQDMSGISGQPTAPWMFGLTAFQPAPMGLPPGLAWRRERHLGITAGGEGFDASNKHFTSFLDAPISPD